MKLSIVIPVYNEAATIAKTVARVRAAPLGGEMARELVIVDDGSSDGTREALAALADPEHVRVLFHGQNRGKGAAIRTGFANVTGDLVLIQDADLEYNPIDYPRLLEPLLDDRADVVFGSRFAGGQSHRVLYYWHSVANKMLTRLSNMLTNLNLTDMEVGYKLFRRSVVEQLELEESGFGVEPELVARVARLGCRVYEVGISYAGRTYEEGKKIRWADGVQAVGCILKYNLWR